MRSWTRRAPSRLYPPLQPMTAGPFLIPTLWANPVLLKAGSSGGGDSHWVGQQEQEKNELERAGRREGVQIELCLMREVCAY